MGLFHFKKKVDAIEKHIAAQQVGPEPAPSPVGTQVAQAASAPNDSLFQQPEQPLFSSGAQSNVASPQAPAAEPFSLPDLPPMPDFGSPFEPQVAADVPVVANAEPVDVEESPLIQESMSTDLPELPELPDLPSFENHPEYEMLNELPDDELFPAEESQLGKPFEDSLVAQSPIAVLDKPLFLDVEEYQDVLSDLNITKSDLKHIHERSSLADHEKKIDTTLDQFKKNILQAKKQLNHVDALLFMR